MPLLFPTQDTLHNVFQSSIPFSRKSEALKSQSAPTSPRCTSLQARPELYTACSTIDDAKNKANQLSAEAAKEFEKASAKAQAKTGHIELYSAKYYAACALGGLLACVGTSIPS